MHGIHHLIEGLIEEAAYESSRQRSGSSHNHQGFTSRSTTDVEQEVKLMYARGEITSGAYHRLLEMAQSDQLGWDDLARVRGEGAPSTQSVTKAPPRKRDPKVVSGLNRLYQHRSRLEAAQVEAEQVLEKLEADAARLRQQAETAADKAQLALSDEATARAYLETRQEALERADALNQRIISLRQDLRRIDTLRDELATREAELKALESGEQLAELEASIREDLLNGR